MSTYTATKPRWFQFRLRTLFVVVTLVAIWLAWQLRTVHERRAMQETVSMFTEVFEQAQPAGGSIPQFVQALQAQSAEHVAPTRSRVWPRIRKWLGDEPMWVVMPEKQSDFEAAKRLFPEALILFCPPAPDDAGATEIELDGSAPDESK
jgi:hypothetical protein